MANFINRTRYYVTSLAKWPFPSYFVCSNCGSSNVDIVDRKYLVTSLARCRDCLVQYRRPTGSPEEYSAFYLSGYSTDKTDTPKNRDPAYYTLEVLRSVKDQSDYARVLKALGLPSGATVFDYGCSWGYGSAQLASAGFQMTGYEISPPNRVFAREVLELDIVDDFERFAGDPANHQRFDVFFSSHVLEHLASVDAVLAAARAIVKSGGYIVIFVPNGSSEFRRHDEKRWRRLWGEVHPLFFPQTFFARVFEGQKILTGASPLAEEDIARFRDGDTSVTASLDGKELACIVRL